MKKFMIIAMSLMMTFLVSTKVFAETGYITTSASAQTELTPNVVDFSVEIITTSKDSMAKAIAENKKISAKVYENLKKVTDKNKDDNLKTSTYNATPIYKYSNNKKVLDCYKVTNTVKVHTTQTTSVGQMMDTALTDGATSVNNVSYNVTNYDEEYNKLLAEATKKAKAQAESIAKALGSEVTSIKSVDSGYSITSVSQTPRMFYSAKAIGTSFEIEESNTNIEVGTMTLSARVNINFYIK